jgi:hypothetical protein
MSQKRDNLPKGINLQGITERRGDMAQERKRGSRPAAAAGAFWFMGWLFTIAFANLVWWKIIVGIVVWPYLLGLHIR